MKVYASGSTLGQKPGSVPCRAVISACKAFHAVLLIFALDKIDTNTGRIVSHGTKLRPYTPNRLRKISPRMSHYNDVIMSAIASQITSLTIVYSTVYSDADQRKHQISASLAFVWGVHRWPVNSPHKGPVTRKVFPFDDVIMCIDPMTRGWRLLDMDSTMTLPRFWRSFSQWFVANQHWPY